MGDFKKNPKQPYVVKVPNKIRKRFGMAEKGEKICLKNKPKKTIEQKPVERMKKQSITTRLEKLVKAVGRLFK